MKKILSIARYTFIENIRNKVFYVLVLFGVILIGAALLLSALGGEQQQRVLLDLGLSAIEFFALITIGFAAVTLVLEEMESKTIYLVLTRPVNRGAYLLGRYAGLLLAVFCGMFIMALLHVGILHVRGWEFTWRYPLAILLSAEKIMIIGSLALFFSLFSTSSISSISFTVFMWVLGHFSQEVNFLGNKLTNVFGKVLVKGVYYVIPNLQYFNLVDFWDVPHVVGSWVVLSAVYGLLYSALFIGFALLFFQHKEF